MHAEPLYGVRRMAEEDAIWQGLVNVVRRMLGLRIKRAMHEAEVELLKQHRLGPECCTWSRDGSHKKKAPATVKGRQRAPIASPARARRLKRESTLEQVCMMRK